MRLGQALCVTLGVALGACGARAAEGPAWPKMAEAETDGGESLAPWRPPLPERERGDRKRVTTEPEQPTEPTEPTDPKEPGDSASVPASAAGVGAGADTETEAGIDEVITVEDIVIEIGDGEVDVDEDE